jgi:hypothetical protein
MEHEAAQEVVRYFKQEPFAIPIPEEEYLNESVENPL